MVNLRPDERRQLEAEARGQGVSLSDLVRGILTAHLGRSNT
jgi:hypothetical protein